MAITRYHDARLADTNLLKSCLRAAERERGASIALLSRDVAVTYREMEQYVSGVASSFSRLTGLSGKLVSLRLRGGPEDVITMLGILRAGASILLLPTRRFLSAVAQESLGVAPLSF